MKKLNRSLWIIGTFAAAAAVAPQPAEAIGIGTALVFACTQDGEVAKEFLDQALDDCGAKKGAKSACQVLEGTPWACNSSTSGPEQDRLCQGTMAGATLGGNIVLPANWTISGNVGGTLQVASNFKERKVCTITPIPNATGNAGKYVKEAGVVVGEAHFSITGQFTLTSPVGATVQVNANANCDGKKSSPAYIEDDTRACEAPAPCQDGDPDCDDREEEDPRLPGEGGEDPPQEPQSAVH